MDDAGLGTDIEFRAVLRVGEAWHAAYNGNRTIRPNVTIDPGLSAQRCIAGFTHDDHLAALAVGSPQMKERQDELMKVNLAINQNVISCAREFGVQTLLGALTHFAYPAETKQPMCEDQVLEGDVISSAVGYAGAHSFFFLQLSHLKW